MADAYPRCCCIMVVIAATDPARVTADKAAAVGAEPAYVLDRLGLVGGCVRAWVLPGQPVQDGPGKDLTLGFIDVRGADLTLTMYR